MDGSVREVVRFLADGGVAELERHDPETLERMRAALRPTKVYVVEISFARIGAVFSRRPLAEDFATRIRAEEPEAIVVVAEAELDSADSAIAVRSYRGTVLAWVTCESCDRQFEPEEEPGYGYSDDGVYLCGECVPCSTCGGEGRVNFAQCPACGGAGW